MNDISCSSTSALNVSFWFFIFTSFWFVFDCFCSLLKKSIDRSLVKKHTTISFCSTNENQNQPIVSDLSFYSHLVAFFLKYSLYFAWMTFVATETIRFLCTFVSCVEHPFKRETIEYKKFCLFYLRQKMEKYNQWFELMDYYKARNSLFYPRWIYFVISILNQKSGVINSFGMVIRFCRHQTEMFH